MGKSEFLLRNLLKDREGKLSILLWCVGLTLVASLTYMGNLIVHNEELHVENSMLRVEARQKAVVAQEEAYISKVQLSRLRNELGRVNALNKKYETMLQEDKQLAQLKILLGEDIKDVLKLIQHFKKFAPKSPDVRIPATVITAMILEKKLNIPAEVILAMAWRESNFRISLLAEEGRHFGIMQVSYGVWDTYFPKLQKAGLKKNSPVTQVTVGALYLSYHKRKKKGLWEALRFYNAGNRVNSGRRYANAVTAHAKKLQTF